MGNDTPSPLSAMQSHAHRVMDAVPWAKALGLEVIRIERARAFARAPWREDLVGDPDHGIIAGGVITALLDNLCGVSITAALDEFKAMATLDLRIDYMRPADAGRDIIGEAECYHITRSVAFTRAWAYHDTRDKIIASASGAFALNDPKRWKIGGTAAAALNLPDTPS
ncbi:MAG: PaaI family thioesterase [Pseudomonadota bacterium]